MLSPFPEIVFSAAKDYLWLLSRGYPQKTSLKLVGDKFMLTRELRQVLYRGISATEKAEARKKRIGAASSGEVVLIDTYNVLFTVNNYLLGKPLFICNDGMLRDAGEMRGRIVNKPVFSRAVDLLLEVLSDWPSATYIHYLDEPIPFSARLSIELSKDMVQMGIEGEAFAVKSPDQVLINKSCDAICTSDSAIIDQSQCKVLDLPFFLLQKYFKAEFSPLLL